MTGDVVPFPAGRTPDGGGRWGRAGQRLDGATVKRRAGSAMADVQAVRDRWAAGQVRPWRITAALDAGSLYGPEVDAACGVQEPAVDEWEEGTRYPSWEQLRRLAALTGYPIGFFVRDGEPVDPEGTSIAIHERARLRARYVASKPPVLAFTVEALTAAGVLVGRR